MSDKQSTIKANFKNVISLAVDIRKSTSLYQRTKSLRIAADLIANFIEEVYVSLNKIDGLWNHFIFAGDGLIAIAYTNDNQKSFDKVFEAAFIIRKIIIKKEKEFIKYSFYAGIGISNSGILIRKIDNMDTQFNNTLFIGESVSYSTKLCSSMPLENEYYLVPRYIAMNEKYFQNLSNQNQKKCTKTNSKYVEMV